MSDDNLGYDDFILPGEPSTDKSLVEKNAKQLADLEGDWSELGPRRQIDYRCRFPNRDRATNFLEKAQKAGFQSQLIIVDNHFYEGLCSVVTEPNALSITKFQEILSSLIDDGNEDDYTGRTSVYGWSYPPKKSVTFWPGDTKLGLANASQARAAVLFGGDLVEDGLLNRSFWLPQDVRDRLNRPRLPFQVVPSEFLRKASALRPDAPEPTASAFAQWVYSLYRDERGTEQDIIDGKEAEQEIWERRKAAVTCNDNGFLRKAGLDWYLAHNGLHLREDGVRSHLVIPHLRVGGEALKASPDLMYARRDKTEVLIVEIKHSRQVIPQNLWPNVWAQLWCYSQLQAASEAKKLTVVGEVWGEAWSRGYGRGRTRVQGERIVCLRAVVRRNPRAPAYERFFRRLFDIYAGQS